MDIGNSGGIASNGQHPRPSPYDQAFGDGADDEFEMDDGAHPATPERQRDVYNAYDERRSGGHLL